MFNCQVNAETALRLIGPEHVEELFHLLDGNRAHLRPWHPWVDKVASLREVARVVAAWQQQADANLGFHAGIWFAGRLCGVINHLTVDWANKCTALSYWLAETHQGRGIMTACCQAMIGHSFGIWKLNRITIECAAHNTRSRAIPERLGFQLEGVVRQIEWLQDHYADHALYGLLRTDHRNQSVNHLQS